VTGPDSQPLTVAGEVRRAFEHGRAAGAATERDRCIRLAGEHNAQCHHADGGGGEFADVLAGDQP